VAEPKARPRTHSKVELGCYASGIHRKFIDVPGVFNRLVVEIEDFILDLGRRRPTYAQYADLVSALLARFFSRVRKLAPIVLPTLSHKTMPAISGALFRRQQ